MKKSVTIAASCILYVVVFVLMLAAFITDRQHHRLQHSDDMLVASEIHNAVVAKLMESVSVAKAMANDWYLIQALEREKLYSEEQNVSLMGNYLSRIKEPFSYAYACVVSDATHRYYRNDGLLKIISPETDVGDAWYSHFISGDKRYSATVWRNTDNPDESVLFLNYTIKSGDRLLGVVSTGVYISDILELLSLYEKKYHVRINLTDSTGLVVLDSNYQDIGVASLANLVLSGGTEQELFRELRLGLRGFCAVKWLPDLEWYFVLRNNRETLSLFVGHWFYLFALVVLASAQLLLFSLRKRFHVPRVAYEEKSAHVDSLTGLRNRNFFKDMYGEHGVFNTTRYECLAVFDIDFFKEANDKMDGDEALVSVVKHMNELLAERGLVLRWGGDEFLVLFELSLDVAYALCRQFCKNVAADGLITVSVGLTEVRLSDTIKKNYYRAAQNCYQVKEMGGNGVIKN